MEDPTPEETWREEQRAIYSRGDPELLARRQQPLAEALVRAAAVRPGERVLDIGAGTGNVALLAARAGASVVAVDLTPRQVEIGSRHTSEAGLDVTWHVADAEELPVEDGSVDVVLSGFGVVYAARPDVAAAEITRVLAPDGRALLTAHPPTSFNQEALQIVDRWLPGTAERPTVDEYAWAQEERLAAWFPGRAVSVERRSRRDDRAYPSVDVWWDAVRQVPVVEHLQQSLSAEDFRRARAELVELRLRHAQSEPDGSFVTLDDYAICRVESPEGPPVTRW